ncbi:hypothetical protein L0222_01255 [bacterium]|nr:hypothetical protein [bacterium]MCI0604401.1 hypothetical protein [bacterium]
MVETDGSSTNCVGLVDTCIVDTYIWRCLMGFPKLPTVGGFKVDVGLTGGTSDEFDGTAKARSKRDRNIEKSVSRADERDRDPKAIKSEQDEKNLQAAKKLKIGAQEGGEEVKTIASQNAQIMRQYLDAKLKEKNRSE